MRRYLVLFGRQPELEARRKGFPSRSAARLFEQLALGWREAAGEARARLVLATPEEDFAGWSGVFAGFPEPLRIPQRGTGLGTRLEGAARSAAALGGIAILVGGDVVPSRAVLAAGFDALEAGAEAVLSPSPDGGISLIGLSPADTDLLGAIRERRRTLTREIVAALGRRGRHVVLLEPVPDIDGKTSLRLLLRGPDLPVDFVHAARLALEANTGLPAPATPPRCRSALHLLPILRGPPLAA